MMDCEQPTTSSSCLSEKTHKKHRRGKKRSNKNRLNPYSVKDSSTTDCADSARKQPQQTNEGKGELRTRYSPQAPRNYTQFLINDQNGNEIESDNVGEFVATNTEVDFTTYLQAQFETDYKHARTSELAQLSKEELFDIVYQLEKKESSLLCSHTCSHCSSRDETPFVNYQYHSDSDDHSDYESSCSSDFSFTSDEETTTDLQSMLSSLQQQHQQLIEENHQLKTNQ